MATFPAIGVLQNDQSQRGLAPPPPKRIKYDRQGNTVVEPGAAPAAAAPPAGSGQAPAAAPPALAGAGVIQPPRRSGPVAAWDSGWKSPRTRAQEAAGIPPERIVGPTDVADTLRDARAYNASVSKAPPLAAPAEGTARGTPGVFRGSLTDKQFFPTTRDTPNYVTTETPSGIIRRPPGADPSAPVGANGPKPGFIRHKTQYGFVDIPGDPKRIDPSLVRDEDIDSLRGQQRSAQDGVATARKLGFKDIESEEQGRVGAFSRMADGLSKSKAGYDAAAAARRADAENFTTGSGMTDAGAERLAALPQLGVLPRSAAEFNAARANGTAFRTGISGADRQAQDDKEGMPRGLSGPEKKAWRIGQARLNQVVGAKSTLAGQNISGVLEGKRIDAAAEENKARTAGEYGVLGRRETANGTRDAAQARADAAVAGKYIDSASRKDVATIRVEADKEISTWNNQTRERVAGMAADGRLEEARIAAGTKNKTYSDVFTATLKGLDQMSFNTPQERASEADRITKYLINQNAKGQASTPPPAGGVMPPQQKQAAAKSNVTPESVPAAVRDANIARARKVKANPGSTPAELAEADAALQFFNVK